MSRILMQDSDYIPLGTNDTQKLMCKCIYMLNRCDGRMVQKVITDLDMTENMMFPCGR